MKDILKITVSLGGQGVGTLQMTPERDRCVFEYDKDWIAVGFSISPWELPLRTGLLYSKENSFRGGFAAFEFIGRTVPSSETVPGRQFRNGRTLL